MHEFQVNKTNFTQARLVEHDDLSIKSPLEKGEVIAQVESFALTANNITYAAMGDRLGYWQFFPAADNSSGDWGIIPVWGFATIVSSNNEQMPVGEKLFGYFPPASLVKMNAVHITSQRFIDGSNHRSALPPGYNVYRRVGAEPGYNHRLDDQRMLLFPLHITSYCLWDYLKEKQWFDAEQVIIISASSKTSIGLAYGLHEDSEAPKCIGMTSSRNHDFVNQLGLYNQVVDYNSLATLDPNIKTAIVDMSGNAEQLQQLEAHLNGNLTYCIQVGLTHWDAAQAQSPFKDAPSEMFFAPGRIQQRIAEWGPKVFEERSMAYMLNSAQKSTSWLNFSYLDGLSAMAEIYHDVCSGKVAPEQGIIINLT